jgi:hypothetical protein
MLEEAASQKDANINIISLPWWVVLWCKVRIISIVFLLQLQLQGMRSGAITFTNGECMRNQCVHTFFFTKVKLIEEEEIIRKQVEVHDV